MAALRLLCAPAWQHRCSRPCWTPAPFPGQGNRRTHRPSRGHSAQLLLQPPPPLYRQTPLIPPSTLGCPSWWRLQQCRTPLCPLHDLHALCSSQRVCIGCRGSPVRFPATRCALFCGGEGGRSCLGCPGTAPGGRVGPAPPVLRRSPPPPLARRPPRDGGGG